MYMIYIWWAACTLLVCILVLSQAMMVPLGQRRLQAIVRFMQIVIVVLLCGIGSWQLGIWQTILLVPLMVLASLAVSHSRPVQMFAGRLYTSYIPKCQPWIARQKWLDIFSERVAIGKKIGLETYDELASVIDNAPFLRHNETKMLQHVLSSRDETVKDHMIPMDTVKKISSSDIIGPLLLDELHKSGHALFAVVDNSGAIVGSVTLDRLVESSHVSPNIKDVMQSDVLRIDPSLSLRQTITTMIKANVMIAIVREGEDIGIVLLKDAIDALLG